MVLESLVHQLSVREVGPNHYVSGALPRWTGNASHIAYGGCAIAVCAHAACKTVAPGLFVYTVQGVFLGPARTDRHIYCRVTATRSTKTLASRQVLAYQVQDDGSERNCMQCFVEFHIQEPALLLACSIPPPAALSTNPTDSRYSLSTYEVLERAVVQGRIPKDAIEAYDKFYALVTNYFDLRWAKDSVQAQSALGFDKSAVTTQDHLAITDKLTAEWIRLKEPLTAPLDNTVALCFLMDQALSFLPLQNNHMDFADAGACSTLEFALRIMQPRIDLHQWHARERKTYAAANGRTLGEARLWADGQLVAAMTQTCILRPPSKTDGKVESRL